MPTGKEAFQDGSCSGEPRRIIVKGTEHVLIDRFDLPRINDLIQVDNLTTGRRQLEGADWPFEGFMDLPMEVRR
jgi:hypothetical protein